MAHPQLKMNSQYSVDPFTTDRVWKCITLYGNSPYQEHYANWVGPHDSDGWEWIVSYGEVNIPFGFSIPTQNSANVLNGLL